MSYAAIAIAILYLLGMQQTELAITCYEQDKDGKNGEPIKRWIRLTMLLVWPVLAFATSIALAANAIVGYVTKDR